MKTNWEKVVVKPDTSLREAIAKIDASGLQVALVLAADNSLLGILTDGNIRRAILAGVDLLVSVSEVMHEQPTSVHESTSRSDMLAIMRSKVLHHLPQVDDLNRVVGLVTVDELLGVESLPNWVVLMVGGLGKRLQPLTDDCPKPLLTVGNKPILESIIEGFVEQGFRRFFLSVNYKAEMIADYFGDGERWGIQIEYLLERKRLGTAGALSLLAEIPNAPIIVMNGDLLANVNYGSLLKFHEAHSVVATMAVRSHDIQVPYGVVHLKGVHIEEIEEKPIRKSLINAGVYVLSADALGHIPAETFLDMPALFEDLISADLPTAAYPLSDYWLDIGCREDFEQAQQDWADRNREG